MFVLILFQRIQDQRALTTVDSSMYPHKEKGGLIKANLVLSGRQISSVRSRQCDQELRGAGSGRFHDDDERKNILRELSTVLEEIKAPKVRRHESMVLRWTCMVQLVHFE